MKDEVIVSGKGTVCIPEEIRHRRGIKPGQKVRVIEEDGKIIIVPAVRNAGSWECFRSSPPYDLPLRKLKGKLARTVFE